MVRTGWANASDSRHQLIRPPEPTSVRGSAERGLSNCVELLASYVVSFYL